MHNHQMLRNAFHFPISSFVRRAAAREEHKTKNTISKEPSVNGSALRPHAKNAQTDASLSCAPLAASSPMYQSYHGKSARKHHRRKRTRPHPTSIKTLCLIQRKSLLRCENTEKGLICWAFTVFVSVEAQHCILLSVFFTLLRRCQRSFRQARKR